MKILLVNPNRYKSPPVPPIGLEYLAAPLEANGHSIYIVDLCFSDDSFSDIDDAVYSFKPDMAGVTVRNIDSTLYHTNEFFMDEIRDIVVHLKTAHGLRVIIGGAGVSVNPAGVLDYLSADFAIAGPAEDTIHNVLNEISKPLSNRRISYGIYRGYPLCLRKPSLINYQKYLAEGGIAGFETHKGCSSSCVFCIEANTRVSFKPPEIVIHELRNLVEAGCHHFHLCDSEFNEDLEYSVEFCSALRKSGLNIQWALYMKPVNFNKTLFRLLRETGVYLITVSMDSWKKCDQYWSDYEKFIYGVKASGIKVAVDFLAGFPYEKEDDLKQYLDNLRRPLPDTIGINTYIRLYKSLRITDVIMKDAMLSERLIGHTDDNTMIKPVFYNHLDTERLRELIGGDHLFRIEGLEKGVNYARFEIGATQ